MGMHSEWPMVSIDQIKHPSQGSIAIGPFGSRMKSDCYVAEGVRVVRGTNLGGQRRFVGEFVHITSDKAEELKSANLLPNDLVFPHRGSIGEVGIVPNCRTPHLHSGRLLPTRKGHWSFQWLRQQQTESGSSQIETGRSKAVSDVQKYSVRGVIGLISIWN